MKYISTLVIVTLFVFGAANVEFKLAKGSPAPKFTAFYLSDAVNGVFDFKKAFKLSGIAGKRNALFSFFTQDCASCKVEIAELMKIQDAYKAKGVDFYLILIKASGEEEGKLLKAIEKRGYTIPVLYHKYPETVFKSYIKAKNNAPLAFPVSYAVDKAGKIAMIKQGFSQKEPAKDIAKIKAVLNKLK